LITDAFEPMVLPDWVPPAVKDTATRFTAHYLNSEIELAILRRLATDPRMKQVWTELTRRDRKTGQFFHPVTRSGSLDNRTQEQTQSDEMGRLFHFAFCAARDRVTVTKPYRSHCATFVNKERGFCARQRTTLKRLIPLIRVSQPTPPRSGESPRGKTRPSKPCAR
jgi:hypothetical protein